MTNADSLSRNDFGNHLDFASNLVATWPEWKRNMLGLYIRGGRPHDMTHLDGGLIFDEFEELPPEFVPQVEGTPLRPDVSKTKLVDPATYPTAEPE